MLIKKPEEISRDDILANKKGFDRNYGITGCALKTSTPAACTENDLFIGKAQQFLLDYLDLDVNSKVVQNGLRRKQKRPDTPMPGTKIK